MDCGPETTQDKWLRRLQGQGTKMIHVSDADWIQGLLDWVLPNRESDSLETKRVSGKMVGKALETVCAFANTNGGWLVLGV